MYYAPVIDGKHIPKAPLEILRDRHQLVDVLTQARTATFVTGFLTEDASTFVLYGRINIQRINIIFLSRH
jgi:hypothetical protein